EPGNTPEGTAQGNIEVEQHGRLKRGKDRRERRQHHGADPGTVAKVIVAAMQPWERAGLLATGKYPVRQRLGENRKFHNFIVILI
ncbi:MAG: hypothetical protein AB7V57_19260, partial [Verrucomicrobiales bacterium]